MPIADSDIGAVFGALRRRYFDAVFDLRNGSLMVVALAAVRAIRKNQIARFHSW
jgi:hypothetical protein